MIEPHAFTSVMYQSHMYQDPPRGAHGRGLYRTYRDVQIELPLQYGVTSREYNPKANAVRLITDASHLFNIINIVPWKQ